jgi:FKBP-type peptidyl-prolyl cis-trans isomerase
MRTLLLGSLVLSSATLWAADPAQPAPAAAAPVPAAAPAAPEALPTPPPPAKLTAEQEKQAFMVQGYIMAQKAELPGVCKELRMNEAEIAALLQGMSYAAKGEALPFDYKPIIPGAQVFFGERAAISAGEHAAEAKAWTDANTAFLAKIDADTAVTKTASGLRYQITAAGSAEKPVATSTVKARYTGKLCDGKVFDSTEENGGEPVEFALSGVIKGWTEGLQLIGKGGKIHLWVPADIGYGNQEGSPLPAGSVLDFEVELVDFK